ncbi:MAG TPA: hypothetical protein PKE27_04660 [Povalibacter sp.]|uniref:hypothetical protein n=1 Tax=Povalibacter sp. TaxID=1962978 RepID=UPI002C2C3897|nr:hypothetical protein [Povalibacter sp.]HMN43837.1 hypothetical protein [Povalibacter sp.]
MPHWDANSKHLLENIRRVVTSIHRSAVEREPLTLEVARQWHFGLMEGLTIPEGEQWRGAFRGEPGCIPTGTHRPLFAQYLEGYFADQLFDDDEPPQADWMRRPLVLPVPNSTGRTT